MQMIRLFEEELISKHCESVYLWVDEARNPAQCLYQDRGYQEIDRVENYYGPGRTGLKMVLHLGSD